MRLSYNPRCGHGLSCSWVSLFPRRSSSSSSLGGPPGEGARHLDVFLMKAVSESVCSVVSCLPILLRVTSPSSPPLPSLRSLHSCTNNMENPGERRKTTEEMGQGVAVSSPPLLQINNIAGKAPKSDGKHRESVARARSGVRKRIPARS